MSEESKNSFAEMYSLNFKEIKEGEIIKGRIVSIGTKDVLVDVGFKSEGLIPIEQLSPEELQIGKEIDVLVESLEDDAGMIILSKEKAAMMFGWNTVLKASQDNSLIEGRIKKKVNGGFLVDVLGIEGFLPLSLSSFRGIADKDILGNNFKFKIVKLNNIRKSIVLSRKEAVVKEKEETKEKLWKEIKIGQVRPGLVKSITDFGAFIDLGGIDGLLHITDMSWSKVSHPSEVVAVSDTIEVMVLNIDKDNNKISLGLKQKSPDPWTDVESKYPVSSVVKTRIVNILTYGIFVELERGIEGLVHISEISWSKRVTNLKESFAIGDIVEAKIINIDKDSRRISLSIRQLEVNPWLEVEKKYPVGSKVSGKVRGFTDYGCFVELEDNLEGMIHVSDMSWTKRIAHPQDILKKGQKIELVILGVDVENRRITLGLKQAQSNPWPEMATRYPIGTSIEAEVVSVTEFGVFVKLEENLEGLVYASEIEKEQMQNLKPADKLTTKVIKVDVEQMKIGLTAKL